MVIIVSIFAINSVFAADNNATDINVQNSNDNVVEDVNIDDSDVMTCDNNDVKLDAQIKNDKSDSISTIKMGKVNKRYNGAIQYYAYFYNSSGSPLINHIVYYQVDGNKYYEATTDFNGVALLTVKINNGNHVISAINSATGQITNDTIKVFKVITGGKNLKVYYDNGNYFKVRIIGDDGKPVKAGEKVIFNLNGKNYIIKTNKNGYAQLKIVVGPGTYKIFVRYNDYIIDNTVKVKNILKPLTKFSKKAAKPTFKYKVKLLGKNYKNKKITVKFNKKTYVAKTNKKGIATFNIKTPKAIGVFPLITAYKKNQILSLFTRYFPLKN